MTRIEMIHSVATELILGHVDLLGDTSLSYEKAQELADKIITRIEAEGMMPPKAPLTTGISGVIVGYDNFWESESKDNAKQD